MHYISTVVTVMYQCSCVYVQCTCLWVCTLLSRGTGPPSASLWSAGPVPQPAGACDECIHSRHPAQWMVGQERTTSTSKCAHTILANIPISLSLSLSSHSCYGNSPKHKHVYIRCRSSAQCYIPMHKIFAIFYFFFTSSVRQSFTSKTPNKDQKVDQRWT